MSVRRRVLENGLLRGLERFWIELLGLSAGSVLAQVIGLLVGVYKARMLGPTALGQVAGAVSLLNFTGLACTMGVPMSAIRLVEREPFSLPKLVGLSTLLAGVGLALSTGVAAVISLLPSGPDLPVVLAYALTPLGGALTFEWAFRYWRRSYIVGALRLASALVQGGTVLAVGMLYGWSAAGTGVASSLATLLLGVPVATYVVCRAGIEFPTFQFAKQQLIAGGLISLGVLAQTLNFNFGQLVLTWHRPEAEVGQYRAAWQVMMAINALGGYIVYAAYPRLVRQRNQSGLATALLYIMVSAALPLVAGGEIVTPALVRGLFGEAYHASSQLLKILLLVLLPLYPSMVYGHILLAQGKETLQMLSVVLGSGLNVLLVTLMVPRWGVYGAAWAAVITEVFIAGIAGLLVLTMTEQPPRADKRFLRPVVATTVMATVMRVSGLLAQSLIVVITVGVVVYGVFYVFLNRNDIVAYAREGLRKG